MVLLSTSIVCIVVEVQVFVVQLCTKHSPFMTPTICTYIVNFQVLFTPIEAYVYKLSLCRKSILVCACTCVSTCACARACARACVCMCMHGACVYPLSYLYLFTQNKTGKISFIALQFHYVTLAIHIINR